MTASVAFFNVNVVLFSVTIQYIVLGVYNLIRLNVKGTAMDYFVLQCQLVFLGGTYALSLAFLFTETEAPKPPDAAQTPEAPKAADAEYSLVPQSEDEARPPKHDQGNKYVLGPRVQGMFDAIVAAKIACGAVLALLLQSVLSCYIGTDRATCAQTWRGDYRVGFAFFYALLTLTALSSLQLSSRKLQRSEFSKSRTSSHGFVFFCVYVMFAHSFYTKFEDKCHHSVTGSKLAVDGVALIALLLNLCLEVLYYNRFHAPAHMKRMDLVYELQIFLHLAFYVTYAVTFEGIAQDVVTLVLVGGLGVADVVAFLRHLYGDRGTPRDRRKKGQ